MKRFRKILIKRLGLIMMLLILVILGCDSGELTKSHQKMTPKEILVYSIEFLNEDVKIVDVAFHKPLDIFFGKFEKIVIVGERTYPFALLFKIMSEEAQIQILKKNRDRLSSLKVDEAILELKGGKFNSKKLWEEKKLEIQSLRKIDIYLTISEENLIEMIRGKNPQLRELRFKPIPIQGEGDIEPAMIEIWGKLEIESEGWGKVMRFFGIKTMEFKGKARFVMEEKGKEVNLLIYEASVVGIKRVSSGELQGLQQKINPIISLEGLPINLKEVKVIEKVDPQNPKEKKSYIVIFSSSEIMEKRLFPETKQDESQNKSLESLEKLKEQGKNK